MSKNNFRTENLGSLIYGEGLLKLSPSKFIAEDNSILEVKNYTSRQTGSVLIIGRYPNDD